MEVQLNPPTSLYRFGELAHLVERLPCTQKVNGSIPLFSTIFAPMVELVDTLVLGTSAKAWGFESL